MSILNATVLPPAVATGHNKEEDSFGIGGALVRAVPNLISIISHRAQWTYKVVLLGLGVRGVVYSNPTGCASPRMYDRLL